MTLSPGTLVVGVVLLGAPCGCASSVQLGLANAPSLGHEPVETRVHDVIANGHDACERSMFPEGGVLRGQFPSCVTSQTLTSVPVFVAAASARSSSRIAGRWVSSYPLGVCPSAPGMGRTYVERPLVAWTANASEELVCDAR